MRNNDAQSLAFSLLAASRALVDGVSAGVSARGFGDVRPAHGFAFARLSSGGATITQLAEHLDVTRQAAAQLVDELEIDPGSVHESTRFREDLDADSLDLYTLVQELEDSYGVKMSDEEAARILSVGQAVDFVLASESGATASRGADPE